MDYLLFFQFEAIVSFDVLGEEEGYLRQRQVYELDLKEHRLEKQENRIVFCLYSQVQVKGRNFSHKLLGCKCLLQSFYLMTPCLTWDSAVHGLTHRCESRLGARVSWEMNIEHRNRELCLCSLESFHGFLPPPRVFSHHQIIH